ncbi:hypothetical protein Sjap_023092 [Stephania japonica]|uniref:non-specific serine/threonine protein kinase n=1 Tax=Stephania japonica TaxID=461633 RepID=A0AAP0ESP4_9MAGN
MTTHDPPWPPLHNAFIFTTTLVISLSLPLCFASETDILVKFRESLTNAAALDVWNTSTIPCNGDEPNWAFVRCNQDHIWGLQLENMSLGGVIDVDTLTGLASLRTLSFMNNSFEGPIPDVKKLFGLKALYLSKNRFSGEIPDDAFDGIDWLKKVRLENNQFEGSIPDFQQKDLRKVNVSNNQLEGPVPKSLSKMGPTAFLGNKNLCGEPLDPCGSTKKPLKPSKLVIAIIVIVAVLLLIIIAAIVIIIRRRNQPAQFGRSTSASKLKAASGGGQTEHATAAHSGPAKKPDLGKLVFIRDDVERFDLPDLLRASAEVLGSATFGSSYKAALLTGPVMVVKRYKQMNNVGREEFQEHMRRLGRLRHPNLLSLVAYYYRKEEKLLVSEFVENGSLAFHLHGNRSPERPGLDWSTRLKIIKGVAKGLAYLYNELPSLTIPHGHLKSSNVLLNESFEPLLTDYCLVPIVSKDHATKLMVAFKSPEFIQHNRVTKKTDVWSLGILILEMLTGKFPENYLAQGNKTGGHEPEDLAKWVNSMVREEWTGEVFDKDLIRTKNAEGEMLKLLKIGLQCSEEDVEKRWDLKEAVEKITEVKERDSDYESSFASEGDVYSSRAMTEDEFSFSMNN